MKNLLSLLFLILFLNGCAQSTIIPFQPLMDGKVSHYPPNDPAAVGIYRSTHPFSSFVELGMITYRIGAFDLRTMYNQLRKDSASLGADAVVDVKITKETHTDLVMENRCTPHTVCSADAACTTEDECHTVQTPTEESTFLITGSMIRRKP